MSSTTDSPPSLAARLGLRQILNARGTVTRLGGAPMSATVVEAMVEASRWTVSLDELHGIACRRLASYCGTEAALATCGASAGLMLGSAAILAGFKTDRMQRLPDTRGIPHEFLVARSHRNGYDHSVRAAGVRLHEVGLDEWTSGAGVRTVEASDYLEAISDRTAAIFYVLDRHSQPPLEQVVALAHAHQLPVLVDAAAHVGTPHHIASIVQTGADLIAFSGGKLLGGPQATGVLCGRKALVSSAFLQMIDLDEHRAHWSPPPELVELNALAGMPRQGIGRMLKVSKEQIAGLLQAIEESTEQRWAERVKRWEEWLVRGQKKLEHTGCRVELVGGLTPCLQVQLQAADAARQAHQICASLIQGSPAIYLGHALLQRGILTIDPRCLTAKELELIIDRLHQQLVAFGK